MKPVYTRSEEVCAALAASVALCHRPSAGKQRTPPTHPFLARRRKVCFSVAILIEAPLWLVRRQLCRCCLCSPWVGCAVMTSRRAVELRAAAQVLCQLLPSNASETGLCWQENRHGRLSAWAAGLDTPRWLNWRLQRCWRLFQLLFWVGHGGVELISTQKCKEGGSTQGVWKLKYPASFQMLTSGTNESKSSDALLSTEVTASW